MKKQIILIVTLCFSLNINAQTTKVKTYKENNVKIFDTLLVKRQLINALDSVETIEDGLVSSAIFNKIVEKDFESLHIIKQPLPQTSLIVNPTQKNIEFNYEKFARKNIYGSAPIAIRGSLSIDYNDANKKSTFINNKGISANTKITFGIKHFLKENASFTTQVKKALNIKIITTVQKFDSIYRDSSFKREYVNRKNSLDTTIKDITNGRFVNIDGENLFKSFLINKRNIELQNIAMKAVFYRKIYKWMDYSLTYSRPSISTYNKIDSISYRTSAKIFNNLSVNVLVNHLIITTKSTHYFSSGIRYQNVDNSDNLAATNLTNLNNYIVNNTNVTYSKKEQNAFDSIKLSKTILLNLGGDYFWFPNKNIGLTCSMWLEIDENKNKELSNKRTFTTGVVLPVKKDEKTKLAITLFLETSSNSKKFVTGRYTTVLGFKVGLPLKIFAD
jgi:hypothetical protein